ncbi:MAG: DNA translocase FtsK [Burkholderiales bacterium]
MKRRKAAPNPLPPRVAALVRESWWLILVAGAIYLSLVLATYDKADPGWSHSSESLEIQNAGGPFGSWLADVLLYLFGASAYWWVVFCLFAILWGYRRIEHFGVIDRRPFYLAVTGFLMLLFASSALETMRMQALTLALPLGPGGMTGKSLSGPLVQVFGLTGATLALLITMAVGFTLFSGLSWLAVMEKLGGWLEDGCATVAQFFRSRKEKKIATNAVNEREEYLEKESQRLDERPPMHIEPPAPELKKSLRVIREKQVPLFEELPDSALPPLKLLEATPRDKVEAINADTLEFTSRLIEKKLMDFGVEVKVAAAYPGPVITRYEIEPAVGVKGSQILNLVRDLARALSVASIRAVETIPGKTCMGLEIPNPRRQTVWLSEILSSEVYGESSYTLPLALGKDIGGKPVVVDLGRMPHLLVAGTTGSGKSVAINAMILSLIYKATPERVRLIFVDPKMLELSVYDGIPHLLAPVVTDMKQATSALHWCVAEMERRYRLMSALAVRNLASFNHKVRDARKAGQPLTNPFTPTPETPEPLAEMPLIVVVIDELADLMMVVGKKVEELITRLSQKARAAGVHLLLATQRPSVDVITGLIKANIPTRIAFQVSAKVDSRTILDQMGAETLLGQGDMLYLAPGTGFPQRVHGAFVGDEEVHRVVEYLKKHGEPQYVDGILEEEEEAEADDGTQNTGEADPLYDQAVQIVLNSRRASISLVQRHLRIGYNRAARLIEQMERSGLVSAMQSNGNREVLVPARREA